MPSGASLDEQLQAFVDAAPRLQKQANAKRRRKPKSAEFVITKGDKRLIKEAAKLQEQYTTKKRRGRKRKSEKFDIAKFAKKPTYKRQKGSLKKAVGCVDKRTTLLSLVRRIPDAKKPISTWLKR